MRVLAPLSVVGSRAVWEGTGLQPGGVCASGRPAQRSRRFVAVAVAVADQRDEGSAEHPRIMLK